ncbi:MAG: hypothetical protein LBN40_04045, partial [Oscillospiraceae bacterium]|nr:hypothetical protein [Oscillospiraceae bacterium]
AKSVLPVETILDSINFERKNRSKRAERDSRRDLIRSEAASSEERLLRDILAFMFNRPQFLPIILERVSPLSIKDEFYRKLYETLAITVSVGDAYPLSSVLPEFSPTDAGKIVSITAERSEFPFTRERLLETLALFQKLTVPKEEPKTPEELAAYFSKKKAGTATE